MTISEKVAYIKGIAEGAGLDKNTPEGKILAAVWGGNVGNVQATVEKGRKRVHGISFFVFCQCMRKPAVRSRKNRFPPRGGKRFVKNCLLSDQNLKYCLAFS